VIALAAGAVLAGALAQMEVTIIGGQAYPMALFPGRDVSSSFADGVVAAYGPSLAEALLGLGGIAIAGLIVVVAVRVLALIPERLDDAVLAAD
jgi:molybdopterin-containing oxidoreductase family membrane subunit